MLNQIEKFHFVCADSVEAEQSCQALIKRYGQSSIKEAQIIVVLGGDGTMLKAIHDFMDSAIPLYGMNKGSIGFLMNPFTEKDLSQRIALALREEIHPLRMVAQTAEGRMVEALAVNEVSLFRQSYQAAKVRISVDNEVRIHELICDGVMLATPAGSTAYNLSAHGPILPLTAPLMALTPACPFRPRRWRGALLPKTAKVRFDLLEADKRKVNVAADNVELKSVQSVDIEYAENISATILFDASHSWNDRILSEQFQY